MWILLLPAAAIALSLVSKSKTGSYNPAELLVQKSGPAVTPGAKPGLGTVNGHGTGVLQEPVAGVPVPPAGPPASLGLPVGPIQGLDPNDPNAPAITAAAASAAEGLKQEIIAALNTPEADRTPEQAALLSGLAILPTT